MYDCALLVEIVTYFFQHLVQTLFVYGFENIVKRIGLESLYGILVVGGQEKNNRHGFNVELLHDLETINSRHLYVQENQVRGFFLNELQGFSAIIGLANNFDVRDIFKTMCQTTTREGFVIHDQGLKEMLVACFQSYEDFPVKLNPRSTAYHS